MSAKSVRRQVKRADEHRKVMLRVEANPFAIANLPSWCVLGGGVAAGCSSVQTQRRVLESMVSRKCKKAPSHVHMLIRLTLLRCAFCVQLCAEV